MKGTLLRLLSLSIILFFQSGIRAQCQKWDGEAGNGLWSDPLNWNNDSLPAVTDSVLLDHSLVTGSYSIQMPSGNTAVIIRQLTIKPHLPFSITVEWPVSNTRAGGFWVQGSGGISLYDQAVFINASGASPGTAIVISDSLYLFNGARWIHRTITGHASYLSKLSRAPGTEKGLFEFDVPGTGGYAVSVSGRQFGILRLRNTHSSTTKSYFSNGSQPLLIRDRLEIDSFVQYALDFNAPFTIQSDLICHGNFDLSAGIYNTIIALKGNLYGSGRILESGVAKPILEFSGTVRQSIRWTGQIIQSIGVRLNNLADVLLESPLSLPFELQLVKGRLFTSNDRLLTLQTNAGIHVDSNSSVSFIHGPVKKIGGVGGNGFLFPVGKNNQLRWIGISGYNGDVQVEYFNVNPATLSNQIDTPLKHISRMEYWQVKAAMPERTILTLSFDDVNSGGVTDLSALSTAILRSGSWKAAGNSGVTGTAGGRGSVRSDTLDVIDTSFYMCLGSIDAFQNPLPIATLSNGRILLEQQQDQILWRSEHSLKAFVFMADGKQMKDTDYGPMAAVSERGDRGFLPISRINGFKRLEMIGWDESGHRLESNSLLLKSQSGDFSIIMVGSTRVGVPIPVHILSNKTQHISLIISDIDGKIWRKETLFIHAGLNRIHLQATLLKSGYFQLFGVSSTFQSAPRRFFRFF